MIYLVFLYLIALFIIIVACIRDEEKLEREEEKNAKNKNRDC